MNLICNSPKCNGQTIPYALIDGYPVGDRLLEDVIFQVSVEKNNLKVEVSLSDLDYFSQLNKSMWYKRIEEYFESGGYSEAECGQCGQEECIEII